MDKSGSKWLQNANFKTYGGGVAKSGTVECGTGTCDNTLITGKKSVKKICVTTSNLGANVSSFAGLLC